MTIGIGFRCVDGIVMATDSQYTRGGMKSHGPKIFKPIQSDNLAVLVAGAGRVPFMKRAAEKLGASLAGADPTLEEFRAITENVLRSFFREHVYPIPDWQQGAFELILGVWTKKEGYGLFSTDETVVSSLHARSDPCCIGTGRHVSEYALSLTFDIGLNVEKAKLIAAFAIKAAKDWVGSCGGQTRISFLKDSGLDYPPDYVLVPVHNHEVATLEQGSVDLYEGVKYLLDFFDTKSIEDDSSVDDITTFIRDTVLEFRTKQRERRYRIEQAKLKQLQHRLIKQQQESAQTR